MTDAELRRKISEGLAAHIYRLNLDRQMLIEAVECLIENGNTGFALEFANAMLENVNKPGDV